MALYPNLRNILSREFPPSRSAAGAGGDILCANSCSQVSVTYPGSVSTFLSYHAPGSSLGMTLSWVVSIPGSTLRWCGLHESVCSPTGIGTMALKPSFSPLQLDFWRFRPLHSLLYPWASGGDAISVLYWRRHQRLVLATPLLLSDASSSSLRPLNGFHRIFDFDFSQRPGAGR